MEKKEGFQMKKSSSFKTHKESFSKTFLNMFHTIHMLFMLALMVSDILTGLYKFAIIESALALISLVLMLTRWIDSRSLFMSISVILVLLKYYMYPSWHYEYVLMVLFVHSAISLDKDGVFLIPMFGITISCFLSCRLFHFIYFIVNGKDIEVFDPNYSYINIRNLNHITFYLAPLGVVLFRTTYHSNIDFLKGLQDEVKRDVENESDFIQKFSHCCRTYLNGINIFAQSLRKRNNRKEHVESLNLVGDSISHVIHLVQDLVDYHRLQNKSVRLIENKVDIRKLINDVCRVQKGKDIKKIVHVKVLIEITESVPRFLKFDYARMQQILSNLVSNSMKYTEKGYVRIEVDSVKLKDSMYRLTILVKDSGIGIPRNRLSQVFVPFSKVNETNQPSLGLGLVITKELALLFNEGSFTISSSGKDKGTIATFVCVLEKVKMDDCYPLNTPSINAEGLLKLLIEKNPYSILVVEDNMVNRVILTHFLRKLGFQVDYAVNGNDAINKILQKQRKLCANGLSERMKWDEWKIENKQKYLPYDLIFMDLRMPEKNGKDATAEIRKELGFSIEALPIVCITAEIIKREGEFCRKWGFNDFISKPIKKKNVVNCLLKIVQSRLGRKDQQNKSEKVKDVLIEDENELNQKDISEVKKKENEEIHNDGRSDWLVQSKQVIQEGKQIDEVKEAKSSESEGVPEKNDEDVFTKVLKKLQKFNDYMVWSLMVSCCLSVVFMRTLAGVYFSVCFVLGYEIVYPFLVAMYINDQAKHIISKNVKKESMGDVGKIKLSQNDVKKVKKVEKLMNVRKKKVVGITKPFAVMLLMMVLIGSELYNVSLWFLAFVVYSSFTTVKTKHFRYIVFCGFGVSLFYEFVNFGKLPIDIDTWSIRTVIFAIDVLYFCQIAINMFDLVLKKKEQEQQIQKSIDRLQLIHELQVNFAAKISHQIRAPCKTSSLFLNELRHKFFGDEDFRLLCASLDDLARISDNLVEYFRMKYEKMHLNLSEVHITKMLREFFEFQSDIRKESENINFEVKFSTDFPRIVKIDELKVKHLMGNLLVNSFQNTKNGRIYITVLFAYDQDKEDMGTITFTILDEGCAISKETLLMMKEPSFPFTHTINTLGLGIMICKKYANLMKGSLSIQSTEGDGTDVTVQFPVQICGKKNDIFQNPYFIDYNFWRGMKDKLSFASIFPHKILMVEDSVMNEVYIKHYLQMILGYGDIDSCKNGETAAKLFDRNEYSIAFVDYRLGDCLGEELANKFQKTMKQKSIECRLIMCTGSSNIHALAGSTFDRVVVKPIDIQTVIRILYEYRRGPEKVSKKNV